MRKDLISWSALIFYSELSNTSQFNSFILYASKFTADEGLDY